MPYAIYCQNYLRPNWREFVYPVKTPSRFAILLSKFGFTAWLQREQQSIDTLAKIDPAKDVIAKWCKEWSLPQDSFTSRPEYVDLPSTKCRVSEVYTNRDDCAKVFDLKFADGDARGDHEWGSETLWEFRYRGDWGHVIGWTSNVFTIETVEQS